MMRVSELMTPAPVQVPADTPLVTCALRMEHLGMRHLPVVAPDGHLLGVAPDSTIHRYGAVFGHEFVPYDLDVSLVAADIATPEEVVAHPDDELPAVMRRLTRTRQDFVVVTDAYRHPIGVLTEHDLLKVALLALPHRLTVDDLPPRHVVTLDEKEPGSVALDLMIQHQIRHIPVTGTAGAVLGVVSYRDLVAADVKRRLVTLDQIRSGDAFTVPRRTALTGCATRMLEFRVGCLPVIEKGRAVRMVTRRDLVDVATAELEAPDLFDPQEVR